MGRHEYLCCNVLLPDVNMQPVEYLILECEVLIFSLWQLHF